MSLIIIGMSGKRGVGKTEAAKYLRDVYKFKIVSFASRLKETAELLHPGIGRWPKERARAELGGATPREYYISLGAHERFYDPDFWVKASGIANAIGRIVIDDVRFPNEVAYLKNLGGKIIRLKRFEKLNIYGKDLDDPSETSLDSYKEFDFLIEDCVNVTIQDLYKQMDIAMRDFEI